MSFKSNLSYVEYMTGKDVTLLDKEKPKIDLKKCECLICFNQFKSYQASVHCNFCNNVCHYKCYKNFTRKNNYYAMKCLHCRTRSIYFRKPWWMCYYI